MAKVVIDLQEGFSNDTVDIVINGKTLVSNIIVNTDYSTGLAKSFKLETEDDTAWVEVLVKNRQLISKILININSVPYIGVSITENGLSYTSSTQEFTYF